MRLIDKDGEMLGVVPLSDAMFKAKSASLDLVEISPNSTPPVCKILDFGRYKYEAKKRQQDAKKKQKTTSLKEMKFKLNIGTGDFDVKIRKIRSFIEDGDKVKISLWFKGREIVHNELGMQLFGRIKEAIGDIAKIDAEAKLEGKQIIMSVSPLPASKK